MNTQPSIFDSIVDAIVRFTDYYIIEKHITLSEGFLFTLGLLRSVWFMIFGVQLTVIGPVSHEVWMPVFWGITIFHFLTFFLHDLRFRIIATTVHAFTWCFLAILMCFAQFTSPAVPTFTVLSLLAVFISVRLMRDNRQTVS